MSNIRMIDVINEVNPLAKSYEVIKLVDLQAELVATKGAKIVSLTTVTMPDFIKGISECPFNYDLYKISHINGMLNGDYKAAVNKQREKEGKEPDFEPQKRKWGTHIENSPFISHILKNGLHKLYLEVRILKSITHAYYQYSQKKIYPDSVVNPFLREKTKAETQDLEKEIILRTYDVKNIITIVYDDKGYFLEENL